MYVVPKRMFLPHRCIIDKDMDEGRTLRERATADIYV